MSRSPPCPRQFHRDERGAAIIEMAVVFPVLLAIGLGVLEFGNLIYSYHLIANGVRDGARYASGLPKECCDDDVKSIAMTGALSGADYRVSWWDDPATETTVTYSDVLNDDGLGTPLYRGGDVIWRVTVTASVPYDSLGFLGYFGLNAPTLVVSHEERLIGVR